MKATDFIKDSRGLTVNQISAKITESRQKLVKLEQDKVLGKIKNLREITSTRKNIARLMTILDEKVSEQVK